MTDISTAAEPAIKKKRIWELDALRGLLIVLVVIDHLMMDLSYQFGPSWLAAMPGNAAIANIVKGATYYYNHPARLIIQPAAVMLFITLCGVSCGLSRSNLKRGIILAVVAGLVSLVTYFYEDGKMFIGFNVLHALALDILIWSAVELLTKKNRKIMTITGLAMCVILGWIALKLDHSPQMRESWGKALYILTKTEYTLDRSPGDFIPFFPWGIVFFAAAALSPVLYPDKKTLMPALDGKWSAPLQVVGRHTLIIYLAHQVIFVALLAVISKIMMGSWVVI